MPGKSQHIPRMNLLHLSLIGAFAFFTMASARAASFTIDKSPLDPEDRQYTNNIHRSYVVASCVPQKQKAKLKLVGSSWKECNDVENAKDKVVESRFISCLDYYENGVMQGFFIKEINNRTWESFRFACRDMKKDGTVGIQWTKAPFLFNFEKDGELSSTKVPTTKLAVGVLEISNHLTTGNSLLSVALIHADAAAIFNSGTNGRDLSNPGVTPRIPPSSPISLETDNWMCPHGMVLTGAAIGHIPENTKSTRPVYILGECRKIIKSL